MTTELKRLKEEIRYECSIQWSGDPDIQRFTNWVIKRIEALAS